MEREWLVGKGSVERIWEWRREEKEKGEQKNHEMFRETSDSTLAFEGSPVLGNREF